MLSPTTIRISLLFQKCVLDINAGLFLIWVLCLRINLSLNGTMVDEMRERLSGCVQQQPVVDNYTTETKSR